METAPTFSSLSTSSMARLVADYVQLRQETGDGSSVDSSGPYGQLLSQLDKLFKPLLGQASSDPQAASDQQAMMAAPYPAPYSTDGIPADVRNEPMSQLPPEDLQRAQTFTNNAMMATPYRSSSADIAAGDYGAVIDTNFTGSVRDHRSTSNTATVTYNSGGVEVRDHRHPVPYPVEPPPVAYPPAAPPPVTAPPPSSTGTAFTSAADYDKVNQASSNLQAAKQDALNNPDDPAKQIAFQEAAQTLQLLVNMLTQLSSMFASIADSAIKASKVNAS